MTSRTIRNRLIEKGLKAQSTRTVPYLKETHMQNRIAFAKKHLKCENWKNVLWSDETKINLFGSDGKQYVRRQKNIAYDHRYTIKTIKHGGGNIKLFDCFF